ncbi:MAG: cadmium-translocating P-type ATPase [Clostridia bacterium]|nr:cadmium-translocating P-type ATPase [Clostridia bacterium]
MNLSKGQRRTLVRILLAGAVLAMLGGLALGGVLPEAWYIRLPLFLIPYVLVGWDVLWSAVRGVLRGQLLDENFLMALATLGALVIDEYPEAVFVMLFYQVGELFQSIAVGKSRKSIAALMDIRPDEARVEREGSECVVDPDDVIVGEVIVIRPGEKIPLDGVVIEGRSELNTLSLTGEALPRDVAEGDEVLSGCVNISGLLWIRVTKPFGESTVSKILELVENSTLVKSKAENAVTKFAHWYTPAVVVGAVLLAVVPSLITGEWQRWLHSALIFLVVSCPCALVISVPLSYFGGLGCASRHGVLVKGANRLESLANTETVVFDKTGTLTEGSFSVTEVIPTEGIERHALLRLCAAAEQFSNHPIAVSLRASCTEAGAGELPHAEAREIAGLGVLAVIDGRRVLVGNAALMRREKVDFAEKCSAGTVIYVASDGKFLGSIVISDTVKKGACEAIRMLRQCGVKRTVMLTGDRTEAAKAVADRLQIGEYHASLLPADKVERVEKLLEEKQGVLVFVGDGVNDAPVLARADVGIAMGALGSDAAIEAADVVLMDDDPTKIADAIRISRFTRRIVWQNIVFALGIKALFLVLSVFGLTNMWAATFADVGVAVIAILNAMRTLRYHV